MNQFLKGLVKEIADEEGILLELLSKEWIIKLTKGEKIGYIVGSKFSINSDTASRIASDKYATYEVLKSANIPVIEHHIVFHPKTRKNTPSDFQNSKEIYRYFKEKQNEIVVKQNEGFGGNMVYLCKTKSEIRKSVKKILKRRDSLSICPFYHADAEYRLVMLDGECKLLFGKQKAEEKWKFNLCQGAKAFMVDDEKLKNELILMAQKVVTALGIRFASVDIIQTQEEKKLLVMEVNSGVMIHKFCEFVPQGRDIAKTIYKEAILKMFDM